MGENGKGWNENENDFTLFGCGMKMRKEKISLMKIWWDPLKKISSQTLE